MSPPVSLDDSDGKQPPPQAVGIIYPPPEVRNIVDKTAAFVARNGHEFEQRIKQNEVNNPKFNFLNPGDPYHAYYQHRVVEIREGKDEQKQEKKEKTAKAAMAGGERPAGQATAATEAMKQRQSELLKQAQKEQEPAPPSEPPPEFEFISDPPSISAFDLDVVKLTAQFVARNGRQFLTQLMQKEQRNYQFDFLRPQHSLFQYFTKLLEQYTKVLIPPKDLLAKLREESKDDKSVLSQVDYRVRWVKAQEAKKRKEEEEAERERVSYAQVDWHNFVVVETVDYQPWESGNFPPPTNPNEVGARVLMQRRVESLPSKTKEDEGVSGESNTNVEDMEEGSSSEEESDEEEDVSGDAPVPPSGAPPPGAKSMLAGVDAAPAVNQPPPPNLPTPGNVEVRAYDPKQAKAAKRAAAAAGAGDAAPEEFLVSPITGERVPASKVQEHMRIGLLDPRWVEERDKQITARASEDIVFAPGQAIESSLKQLAERRTDIFGVGEEAAQETAIGKKMGEEERRAGQLTEDGTVVDTPPKVVAWDGHSSSAEAATAKARASVTVNDQIEQIYRQKGLLAEKEKIGPKVTEATPAPPSTVAPAAPPPMQPPVQAPPAAPIPPPVAAPPPPPVPLPPPQQPPMVVQQQVMAGLSGAPPQAFFVAATPGFPPMAPPQAGPPMVDLGGGPSAPAPAPPPPPVAPVPDEPPAKRPRGEDHLLPEPEFLAQYSHLGPVAFHVVCPGAAGSGSSDWKLHGQTVALSLPLSDTVSVIKARLHEETGMPPGKQKLQLESIFLKDANSLAYYNIRQGAVLSLQVKERGGRKK